MDTCCPLCRLPLVAEAVPFKPACEAAGSGGRGGGGGVGDAARRPGSGIGSSVPAQPVASSCRPGSGSTTGGRIDAASAPEACAGKPGCSSGGFSGTVVVVRVPLGEGAGWVGQSHLNAAEAV